LGRSMYMTTKAKMTITRISNTMFLFMTMTRFLSLC
jgi:hypothetical protein